MLSKQEIRSLVMTAQLNAARAISDEDHLAGRIKPVDRIHDARQLGYRNVEQAAAATTTVADRLTGP
jgi:hypothetical protein